MERLTAEPWCWSLDTIANLTDYQIERIVLAQSKAIDDGQRPTPTAEPDEPMPSAEELKRGSGQWSYLKSQGYSDEEAEAKLRRMRGE